MEPLKKRLLETGSSMNVETIRSNDDRRGDDNISVAKLPPHQLFSGIKKKINCSIAVMEPGCHHFNSVINLSILFQSRIRHDVFPNVLECEAHRIIYEVFLLKIFNLNINKL